MYTQLSFETENYIKKPKKNDSNKYSTIKKEDKDIYIKAIIYKQSSRIVYSTSLSFWDIAELCEHTPEKPKDDVEILMNIDELKNRYLDPKHGKEINLYIKNNIDSFILPSLTTIVNEPFDVIYDLENKETIYSYKIKEEISKSDGVLFGYIKFDKDMKFKISDGNHRTYAIHDLINNEEIDECMDGLYIGVDFYLETDKVKEKELFVNLNTNKPIDKNVTSILNCNSLMSKAAKSIIGKNDDNYVYMVPHLCDKESGYLGIDYTNSNITKTNNTLSFYMIQNIISYMIYGVERTDKIEQKFEQEYNGTTSYKKMMKKISKFLSYIFKNLEPFNMVNEDLSNVKNLREEYISMTGAGLYTIAKIGHIGIKYDEIDIEVIAEALCKLEWKRSNNGILNPIFLGNILTNRGTISTSRGTLINSTEKIRQILKLTDKDIEKALKYK